MGSCPSSRLVILDEPKGSIPAGFGALTDLKGRVKSTGRTGHIVSFDRDDLICTYKVRFTDGEMPQVDWFTEASLQLCAAPFAVTVETTFLSDETWSAGGEVFQLSDLRPDQTLGNLYRQLEKKLEVPRGSLHLEFEAAAGTDYKNCKDDVSMGFQVRKPIRGDLNRMLGVLGIGEGSRIECIVNEFDPARLRLSCAYEHEYDEDGELVTHTIWALVYTKRLVTSGNSVLRIMTDMLLLDSGYEFLDRDRWIDLEEEDTDEDMPARISREKVDAERAFVVDGDQWVATPRIGRQSEDSEELLLWASDPAISRGAKAPDLHYSISEEDGVDLQIEANGREPVRLPVSTFMMRARQKPKTASLEAQFKARFGDKQWPLLVGRICRKLLCHDELGAAA
jgi:hypothetical protein